MIATTLRRTRTRTRVFFPQWGDEAPGGAGALTSPGSPTAWSACAAPQLVEPAAAFCSTQAGGVGGGSSGRDSRTGDTKCAADRCGETVRPQRPMGRAPPVSRMSGKTEEWKPAAWDPGSAFNAFQQETPQGSRRGSAAKARGRGARRNSSRRSAPAVEEQTLPRKEPDNSSSSATNLPFNFHGLQIGEESDEKVPDADFDGVGVAEMDTEVDPELTGQSPLRASVVPPASHQLQERFICPCNSMRSGLTAATVPQFNISASVSRSSRGKPRRKSRQREPSQGSSTAGVDAPPIASSNVGEKPDSATAESTSSDKASIAAVRLPRPAPVCPPSQPCIRPPGPYCWALWRIWSHAASHGLTRCCALVVQANRLRAEGNTAYNRSDYLGAVASYR